MEVFGLQGDPHRTPPSLERILVVFIQIQLKLVKSEEMRLDRTQHTLRYQTPDSEVS